MSLHNPFAYMRLICFLFFTTRLTAVYFVVLLFTELGSSLPFIEDLGESYPDPVKKTDDSASVSCSSPSRKKKKKKKRYLLNIRFNVLLRC